MRWFVEVSRVGDDRVDEKYCVDAKQWQAALQEARKLRGDSGPLSKFSIELLDDGYRAVDPKQKLRFVVAKAPQDAELTVDGAPIKRSPVNGQSVPVPAVTTTSIRPAPTKTVSVAAPPVVVPSVAPPVVVPSAVPPAAAAPVAAAVVAAAPPIARAPAITDAEPSFVASHAEPYAGVPSSDLSPHAPAPSVELEPVTALGAKSASPPRPSGAAARSRSAKAAAPSLAPAADADAIPPAPAIPQGLGPAVAPPQNFTQPSPAIDMPAKATVLRKREEEPTAESPITYRELAYVVEPGSSRGSVESLLWAIFRDVSRELADRVGQKFVQLAVFDHHFDKRPERAPLGTLAWKDWRGNPVLTFPLFDGTQPARASVPAPGPSIKPVRVVQISSSAPPAAASSPPAAPSPALISSPPVVASSPPVVVPSSTNAAEATDAPRDPLAPIQVEAEAPAAVVVEAPRPEAAPAAPAVEPAAPAEAAPIVVSEPRATPAPTRDKQPSHPSAGRGSRPRMAAVRRRAGEDLIGELFETMHDLNFMRGIADGAEFVLAAVDSIVPCDGVLIQVFDINKRDFVVVRARGPGAMPATLHRTPDNDPFLHAVMRRSGSVAIVDVSRDQRVLGARWDVLGVKPQRALCGPVRQGGRYLGLIELANPLGDAPFHQTEQNAIDYVCEQFAQFLANRPIVLDPDVILRR